MKLEKRELLHRPRRLRKTKTLRRLVRENWLNINDFIYPLFIIEGKDIKHPITGEIIIKKKKLIDELDCELIDSAGVKTINVYSVITCESKKGVCQTCYGRDLARGNLISIGEAIGMIAAQSIGEPGTQLTMRTFHVGGTAQVKEESQIVAHSSGKIKITNRNVIEDSRKNKIVMGRNTQISIEDESNRQIAIYKIPYGAKLYSDNGDKVVKGKKICEWDPYTLPVIAEKSGTASYMDLVDGVSLAETVDDATGIASKSVLDWRSQSKNTELKPRITLRDEKGNVIKKADDNEARYYLVPDSILSVNDGQEVSDGTNPLAIISESNIESTTNGNSSSDNVDDSTEGTSDDTNIQTEEIDMNTIIAWTIGFAICGIVFLVVIRTMNPNQNPIGRFEEE